MVALKFSLSLLAVIGGVAATFDDSHLVSLLKRQAPGTPAYNCHDNCGQSIVRSRAPVDICIDYIFLSNYGHCIQCSGPDNVNIWHHYAATLTSVAGPCGLPTAPLSGVQPDVPPAIPGA